MSAEDRKNLELLQDENKRLQDNLSALQMAVSGIRSGCNGVLEKGSGDLDVVVGYSRSVNPVRKYYSVQ